MKCLLNNSRLTAGHGGAEGQEGGAGRVVGGLGGCVTGSRGGEGGREVTAVQLLVSCEPKAVYVYAMERTLLRVHLSKGVGL